MKQYHRQQSAQCRVNRTGGKEAPAHDFFLMQGSCQLTVDRQPSPPQSHAEQQGGQRSGMGGLHRMGQGIEALLQQRRCRRRRL